MNDLQAWPAIQGHPAAEGLAAELLLLAERMDLDAFLAEAAARTARSAGGTLLIYRAAQAPGAGWPPATLKPRPLGAAG